MRSVDTINCHAGDIIAEDVYSKNDIILVTKNTAINEYIRLKLIDYGIFQVKIYDSVVNDKQYVKFEKVYKESVLHIKELLRSVTLGEYGDVEKVTNYIADNICSNMSDSDYIICFMNRIKCTDEYTFTHCVNVAFYSMLIGKWLEMSKKKIFELVSSGLIHDIGKTKIPDSILNKKGKLTQDEFEVIKTHPYLGFEMIKNVSGFHMDLKQAVLMHHERMDGSGYPYGLTGQSINRHARIIAIADVFDAMTQNRIYKNKVSPFESFEMFLTEGVSQFDYPILSSFLKHMAPLYVGNKVKLSNGDNGEIVYVPPQNITSPILYTNSQYLDMSRNNEIKVLQLI